MITARFNDEINHQILNELAVVTAILTDEIIHQILNELAVVRCESVSPLSFRCKFICELNLFFVANLVCVISRGWK